MGLVHAEDFDSVVSGARVNPKALNRARLLDVDLDDVARARRGPPACDGLGEDREIESRLIEASHE